MNSTCIIVADAGSARFYAFKPGDAPRATLKLVELASLSNAGSDLMAPGTSASGRARTETNADRGSGLVHPMEAQRERHRLELDRRFGQEIANRAAEATRGWKAGTIVLVAEPRLLGLLREPLRKALHQRIELKELAKDFAGLALQELQERLESNKLLPRLDAAR